MGAEATAATTSGRVTISPRYDSELGRYVWEEPAPSAPVDTPIAPLLETGIDLADLAAADPPAQVATYGEVYREGIHGTVPGEASEFDPLAEWRTDGEVADSILAGLPVNTPQFIRLLLTALLGGLRDGGPANP